MQLQYQLWISLIKDENYQLKRTLNDLFYHYFLVLLYTPTPTPSPTICSIFLYDEELNGFLGEMGFSIVGGDFSIIFLLTIFIFGNLYELLIKGGGSEIYISSIILSYFTWIRLSCLFLPIWMDTNPEIFQFYSLFSVSW